MGAVDGFETVTIGNPAGTVQAQFVPDANMVCHSLTHLGVELLDGGHGVRAYAEQGKTMGIPLLHPWANRLASPSYAVGDKRVELPAADGRYALDPNGLPIHGALPGKLRWRAQNAGEDRLEARLEWSGAELLELFPFVHELRLQARVDDAKLALVTTLRATDADAVPVSFGYHPYLIPPGDLGRADWQVALGASRRLVLDAQMIPTGDTVPLPSPRFRLGEQSFDEGLSGLSTPPEFTVAAGPQPLRVTFENGYPFAQVYAPPDSDFICFEPMTAPTNALVDGSDLTLVAPGGEYRTAFTITFAENQ